MFLETNLTDLYQKKCYLVIYENLSDFYLFGLLGIDTEIKTTQTYISK